MNKRTHALSAALGVTALLATATALPASGSTSKKATPHAPTGLALARARVAAYSKNPKTIGITQKVPVPKHLKIAYVQCAEVVCTVIGQGIKEAAAALGATYVSYIDQDTASTVATAMQNAVQSKPSMVLTSGDPTQWYQSSLNKLKAAHIPLVAWSLPLGYRPGGGVTVNLITNDDYYFQGVLMADWAAVKTNGKAHVLFLGVPQYPVLATEALGVTQEFARICPKTCKVTSLNFTVAQLLAGAHIPAAVAALQKNSSINYMIAAFGGLLPGMYSALNNAGFGKLQAISQAGTSANYQLILSHQTQAADVGLPTEYLGWRAVDAGLRAIAKQNIGQFPTQPYTSISGHPNILVAGIPTSFLTTANIKNANLPWNPVAGFKAQFKKLWIK